MTKSRRKSIDKKKSMIKVFKSNISYQDCEDSDKVINHLITTMKIFLINIKYVKNEKEFEEIVYNKEHINQLVRRYNLICNIIKIDEEDYNNTDIPVIDFEDTNYDEIDTEISKMLLTI